MHVLCTSRHESRDESSLVECVFHQARAAWDLDPAFLTADKMLAEQPSVCRDAAERRFIQMSNTSTTQLNGCVGHVRRICCATVIKENGLSAEDGWP